MRAPLFRRKWPGVLVLAGVSTLLGCPPPQHESPPARTSMERATGFGVGGVVLVDPSTGQDVARAIAAYPSHSYFFVVGSDEAQGAGDSQWRIEKRDWSGALDANFGTGGVLTVNPGAGADTAVAVLVDGSPGTYFWVAGTDSSPGGGDTQWRIEMRRQSDGALALGFGSNGIVVSNPSNGRDDLAAMVALSGAVYLVGTDESAGTGDAAWRIEKRSLLTGALDTGYGSGGVVTSNPSTGADAPTCAAIDVGGTLLIGGYDSSPGDRQWRIEMRQSSGAPVSGFGSAGAVTTNPSTGPDEVTSLALGCAFLSCVFIYGWDESPGSGDTQWRIERRSVLDGTLSTGFGTGGVVTVNPSTGPDQLRVGFFSYWFILAGTDYSPSPSAGDARWRFGGHTDSGIVSLPMPQVSDPTVGPDTPFGAWYGGGLLLLVGLDGAPPNTRWRIEGWW